jgi:uncharacterized membrane protein (UPF0127 family)
MRALILATLLSFVFTDALAQQKLPVTRFTTGIHIIQAEVAATPTQREIGLMHRTQLGLNEGMMFIFDRPATYCMWMKNTLLPLSVAFLDSQGVILNIEEMLPQTETSHCAIKPALYALEMNAKWFLHHGINPGAHIILAPKPK